MGFIVIPNKLVGSIHYNNPTICASGNSCSCKCFCNCMFGDRCLGFYAIKGYDWQVGGTTSHNNNNNEYNIFTNRSVFALRQITTYLAYRISAEFAGEYAGHKGAGDIGGQLIGDAVETVCGQGMSAIAGGGF